MPDERYVDSDEETYEKTGLDKHGGVCDDPWASGGHGREDSCVVESDSSSDRDCEHEISS